MTLKTDSIFLETIRFFIHFRKQEYFTILVLLQYENRETGLFLFPGMNIKTDIRIGYKAYLCSFLTDPDL